MITGPEALRSGRVAELRSVAMLSLAFRSDWRYLMDHAEEGLELAVERDYYSAAVQRGEPAGVWWGLGARELGLSGTVTEKQMETVYGDLRHPESGERLGTAPRHYASFEQRLGRLVAAEPSSENIEPERMSELVATRGPPTGKLGRIST